MVRVGTGRDARTVWFVYTCLYCGVARLTNPQISQHEGSGVTSSREDQCPRDILSRHYFTTSERRTRMVASRSTVPLVTTISTIGSVTCRSHVTGNGELNIRRIS